MIKILALIPLFIFLNIPVSIAADLAPVSKSDLLIIANGGKSDDLYIEYNYWFQGGVSVELIVFGDGEAYYHKKVDSKAYQDSINAAYKRGARISPYQWSLANCEYGDYEIFKRADLTSNQIEQLAQAIVDSNVLNTESEIGDSACHELKIMLPGRQVSKTAVLLERSDEFRQIAELFSQGIQDDVSFVTCSKTAFEKGTDTFFNAD
jgi:hypothetical protein